MIAYDFDRNANRLRDAAEKGIALVTVDVLQHLLEMHASAPMSTSFYQALCELGGLVDQVPESILSAFEQTKRAVTLLLDVFDALSNVSATTAVPKAYLHWLLLGKTNCSYNEQETEQAIQFLAYPAL